MEHCHFFESKILIKVMQKLTDVNVYELNFSHLMNLPPDEPDQTIEILMSELDPQVSSWDQPGIVAAGTNL